MFTRKFERRIYIAVAVFLFSGALGVSFGAYILWPSRREADFQPRQPIAFSHKLHAGDLQIECLYCHSQADRSPHASVPPVSTCMNCHAEVQPKDEQGNIRPEIAKILRHWESGTPIRWQKVNDVADFVYFDHSRHIHAGVACQECHGPVERMEHMYRAFGLKMSWCLDCHKKEPSEGEPAFARGDLMRAPIHCSACHR
jgi:hypothetical protein